MQNFKLTNTAAIKSFTYYVCLITLFISLAVYQMYFYIFILFLQSLFIFLIFQNNNLKQGLLSKSTISFKKISVVLLLVIVGLLIYNFQKVGFNNEIVTWDQGLEKVGDLKTITCLLILFFSLARGLTRNKFW